MSSRQNERVWIKKGGVRERDICMRCQHTPQRPPLYPLIVPNLIASLPASDSITRSEVQIPSGLFRIRQFLKPQPPPLYKNCILYSKCFEFPCFPPIHWTHFCIYLPLPGGFSVPTFQLRTSTCIGFLAPPLPQFLQWLPYRVRLKVLSQGVQNLEWSQHSPDDSFDCDSSNVRPT